MGNMGLEKMRKLSEIVPIFSDFSPTSYRFHTFFYISQNVLLAIPHFPPFFHFSHLFSAPAAGWLIQLRLTRKPAPTSLPPYTWQAWDAASANPRPQPPSLVHGAWRRVMVSG